MWLGKRFGQWFSKKQKWVKRKGTTGHRNKKDSHARGRVARAGRGGKPAQWPAKVSNERIRERGGKPRCRKRSRRLMFQISAGFQHYLPTKRSALTRLAVKFLGYKDSAKEFYFYFFQARRLVN